jgi:hypothetical protein
MNVLIKIKIVKEVRTLTPFGGGTKIFFFLSRGPPYKCFQLEQLHPFYNYGEIRGPQPGLGPALQIIQI